MDRKNKNRVFVGIGVGLVLVGASGTHWLSSLLVGFGGALMVYGLMKNNGSNK